MMEKKFSRLYQRASRPECRLAFNIHQDRYVIFSDHHKGDGSGADDFKKNAPLYDSALSFYQEQGYRLIVLGDNEELWENSYRRVHSQYQSLITREISMAPSGKNRKRIRIWGNHDKEVSLRSFARSIRKLRIQILDTVDYRESLCLGQDIFLVHGHQGRFFEDKAWKISRWAVQLVWKTIQNILHIGIDGPAENFRLREDLERKYYHWAKAHKVLLVCGHTHQAIFGSLTHFDRLQISVFELETKQKDAPPGEKDKIRQEIAQKEKIIAGILLRRMGIPPKSFEKPASRAVPCYFNSGCCGFTNGITCIEIDKGQIRLIKWQHENSSREILVEENLEHIIQRIRAQKPFYVKS
jgi:UDP-2,3-diacylglucosamine pyrophosphatase LpxH